MIGVARIRTRQKASEEGFVLLAVIFLLAILSLSLAVAVPKIRQDIQRDRELETMRRGKQYIRAIQLYYRKFHRYPPSVDALISTNNIRFLRKRYLDPVTGKDDWQPVLFGQNKVPKSFGFFGKVAVGAPIAGTGSEGIGLGLTKQGGTGLAGPTNTDGNPVAGDPSTGLGSPNGQTFGGTGVIGVVIPSEKQSILVYKTQDHYNGWEFVYDPLYDSLTTVSSGGQGVGGTNASSPEAPGVPAAPGTPAAPAAPPTNPPPAFEPTD